MVIVDGKLVVRARIPYHQVFPVRFGNEVRVSQEFRSRHAVKIPKRFSQGKKAGLTGRSSG